MAHSLCIWSTGVGKAGINKAMPFPPESIDGWWLKRGWSPVIAVICLFALLWRWWFSDRKHIQPIKNLCYSSLDVLLQNIQRKKTNRLASKMAVKWRWCRCVYVYVCVQGTIRVPAPCQYAHRVAYFSGESLHRDFDVSLADRLFYLWIDILCQMHDWLHFWWCACAFPVSWWSRDKSCCADWLFVAAVVL